MLNTPIYGVLLLSMILLTYVMSAILPLHIICETPYNFPFIHTAPVAVPSGIPRWHECLFQYSGLMVKVKFTLEQAMKAQMGNIHIALAFFYLSTRCGWVVNAMPRPFYLQERPSTHFIGGWVGSRTSLNGAESLNPTGIKSLDHYAIPNMLSQTTYRTYK